MSEGEGSPPPGAPAAERPAATATLEARMLARAEAVVVRPRLAPAGLADALVVLGASALIFAEMLVLPSLAYFAVGGGSTGAWMAAWAVWMAQVGASAFRAVHWLKLDAHGIRLGRWTRPLLPWSEVVAVRPAPPGEVVVRGWLWPPIPPREGTRSLSARGHFAIEHRGGISYFPPDDPARFVDAVRRWAPHALRPASPAESPRP